MAISHGAIGWSTCIANSSLLHDDLVNVHTMYMYVAMVQSHEAWGGRVGVYRAYGNYLWG